MLGTSRCTAGSPEPHGGDDEHTDRDWGARRDPDLRLRRQSRPTMVDPGRAGRSPADGDPRQHHRQYRPSDRPTRPQLLQCRSAVGRHGLLARLRQPAAPRGPHRRHRRAQACPPRRADRVCLRLGPGWCVRQLPDAGRRPQHSGRIRGDPGSLGAGPPRHHVHRSGRTRQGVCHLRWHRRGGRGHRPSPRRDFDLLCLMALDPVRQPRL
jgi:hypothetical protein